MKMPLGAWQSFFDCNSLRNKNIQKQTQVYDTKNIFACVHEKRNNKILLENKERKFRAKIKFCSVSGLCRIYSNEFKHINNESV